MINNPHGGDIYSARNRLQGPVLDFSANINPLGPPPGVLEAIKRSAEDCVHYPDPQCRELTAAIAQRERLPSEWIRCGNGAADLIFSLVFALRPRRALLPAPTFAEYEQALRAVNCAVSYHPLRSENGFMPQEDFLARVDTKTDLVFLCNPNNPTGQPADPAFTRKLARRCLETGCVLALDECFIDFLDEPERFTLKTMLAENPRLFIFRAFTKIYAIPGLRLGYALCSDPGLLEKTAACAQPWAVSVPAQQAGLAALRDDGGADYLARTRALVRRERAFLSEGLAACGCRVVGSRANYLFFRLPDETRLCEKLESFGILVRGCGNYRGLSADYYRAAVRTREENARLLTAMRAVREEGES